MIWFVLVTLPIIFLTSALAVDINSVITAQNQASNLAYSAALAGAYTFSPTISPNSFLIDPTMGPIVAEQTISSGVTDGALSHATLVGGSGQAYVSSDGSYPGDEIVVTFSYQVTGLIFLNYLLGSGSSATFTVTRSAFACVPIAGSGPTSGFCVAPISQ